MATPKVAAPKVAPKAVAVAEPTASSVANAPASPKVAATQVASKATTVLPKPGTALPNSLINRVARSYTPSEKAEALEHAATYGVSAASDKLGISRFSIYDWQRKVAKAATGEGPSPTSGPSAAADRGATRSRDPRRVAAAPGLGPDFR